MTHPQQLPIVVEQGNSPILQMIVRDNITGLYIPDAVVKVTIKDGSGLPVGGQAWPFTLTYSGAGGIYRGTLEDDVGMLAGLTYEAVFEITVSGITREVHQDIYVTEPLGAILPASNPASPAYEGPTLQTMLNEAELAFHKLMLGGAVTVVVDQNGERVEYAAGNINRLSAYIFSLRMQLGLVTGRPLGVFFR